ncbi:AraC family transcriptional regulator [Lapidilactobacillus bayanensis]|uniref:AraC family transcriptional regulator n=1 Tax=Lapidilactobacillus bayanensis TaxID=2485998 RepID=UPI000F792A24|nr:AraC family transcriptional regulator [Lapidilactobacillus bayanensis]
MMKEYLLSFLPTQFTTPDIFRVELAGITFPYASYQVNRPQSQIYCFEYVISGQGTIIIDQMQQTVHTGDCYLLPAGHDHHYWSDKKDPLHKIWINVAGTLCAQLLQVYHLQQQFIFKQTDTFSLFNDLLQMLEQRNLSNQQRSNRSALLFHQLLIALQPALQKQSVLLPETLIKAQAIFDNHLNQALSIQEVANTVNLSASQLTRQFKTYLNQTPYDYYLSQKIELAKLLLRNTNLSSQSIAIQLNFADEHYFSNLFKQKIGIAPSIWRKS